MKKTKRNLRNALKRRTEGRNQRCLCNYDASSQFSANTIYLIKENLSIFITLSLQLFKTPSVFQHLANLAFIVPVNSVLSQAI